MPFVIFGGAAAGSAGECIARKLSVSDTNGISMGLFNPFHCLLVRHCLRRRYGSFASHNV